MAETTQTPTPKPRTLPLEREPWWHPRRWGLTITRDAFLASLRTLAWVAPLTILVWIYAEREQVLKSTQSSIPISVKSADPRRFVMLLSPREGTIMADLEGPNAKLSTVRDQLLAPGGSQEILIPPNMPVGDQPLDTQAQLANLPIFRQNGIKVSKCVPPNLMVRVDEIREFTVPVRLPPGVNNLESATFDPPEVKIRGPAKLLEQAQGSGRFFVQADISSLAGLKPGPHDPDLPVAFAERDPNITVSPSSVHASVKVKQEDEALQVSSVPIFVQVPYALQNNVEVKLLGDTFLTDITITGPKDVIGTIRKLLAEGKESPVKAILEISSQDAGKQQERTLRIQVPEGITVAPKDMQHTCKFELVERNTPG